MASRKGEQGYTGGQFLNFAPGSYLERTTRPVYSLLFLLPFIVFYELGTLLVNTDVLRQSQVRVVSFLWLREAMEYIGFGGRFAWALPAVAVVVILLSLQIASHKGWGVNLADIPAMALECVAMAIPLLILSLLLNPVAQQPGGKHTAGARRPAVVCAAQYEHGGIEGERQGQIGSEFQRQGPVSVQRSLLAGLVTGVGAGIYEELVFRLIMILLLMILLQDVFRLGREHSIILAVLVSAALFSAHHHIVIVDGQIGQGTAFDWTKFGFRTAAGVYFAILFAIRGFGITAGTHAFYNILATLVNVMVFKAQ